jgi:hypothetical protein
MPIVSGRPDEPAEPNTEPAEAVRRSYCGRGALPRPTDVHFALHNATRIEEVLESPAGENRATVDLSGSSVHIANAERHRPMNSTKQLFTGLLLLQLSMPGCSDDPGTVHATTDATTDATTSSTGSTSMPTTDTQDGTTGSTSDADASVTGADGSTGGTPVFNGFALGLGGNRGELTLGPVSQVMGEAFDAVTVAAWLRRNDAAAASQGVLTMGDGTFSDTVFLLWSSEQEQPAIAFYAGGVGARASVVDPTQWVHVVATYDALATSEQVRLYLDGELAASAEAMLSHVSSGDFFVGRFGPTGLWLDGAIDELALWNVALDADEIAELAGGAMDFTTSSGAYRSTETLVAWWRMGDHEVGMGTTVADEVGVAHGQLVGDAAFITDVPP